MGTVRVKDADVEGGVKIIEASDYSPREHQLADGETAPVTATASAERKDPAETIADLEDALDNAHQDNDRLRQENAALREDLDRARDLVRVDEFGAGAGQ